MPTAPLHFRFVGGALFAGFLLLTGACTQSDGAGPDENGDTTSIEAGGDGSSESPEADPDEFDAGRDDRSDAPSPSVDIRPWDLGASDPDAELPPLKIEGLTPSRGPVEGETKFVLEGQGLTRETAVYFGSREADGELIDGDFVGETPSGPGTGAVPVKARDPETGSATLTDGFVYTAPLTVDSVEPDSLPTEGGFQVTLRGTGFTPETRASFGGETALQHDYVDAETLRVLAPAHAPAKVDLRLTNRDETALLRNAIEYVETAAVEKVRPATGSVGGGDEVTLHGRGFESDMRVRFGGVDARLLAVGPSGETATVEIPGHSEGLVDVGVELTDGGGALAEDAFYYHHPASTFGIVDVQPGVGTEDGGTRATVLGVGLDVDTLEVAFGGSPARILEKGPGHAVVSTPAQSPSKVDVRADDGQGTQSTVEDGFEYVPALDIDDVRPREGASTGGDRVVLEGTGFEGVEAVEFGSVPASFTVRDDSKIEVTTPARAPGLVDIRVVRGKIERVEENAFRFYEDLELYGLAPARGSIAGNSYVVIRGRGFEDETLSASFDGRSAASLRRLDAQTLAVRTPPHSPGAVDVAVSTGPERDELRQSFHYYDPTGRSGGTSGGPVEGSVNVAVHSRSGGPIEDAFVMLSTHPNSSQTGRTDRNGLVTLSGPEVVGAQTVTATARHFSSTIVQQVDAANLTLYLSRRSYPSSPPPDAGSNPDGGTPTADVPPPDSSDADISGGGSGGSSGGGSSGGGSGSDDPPPTPKGPPVFKGDLTGLDKLGLPDSNQERVAVVYTTKKRPYSRNPNPGPDNRLYENGRYSIRTRTGDLALVAVGGLYDTETGDFEPLSMAVKRYQSAAKGETYERDLHLDIPLDQTLTFKISNPPFGTDGPDTHHIHPYLDFGFEGVFGRLELARGETKLVEAVGYPSLEGKLSDLEVVAIGGAYTIGQTNSLGIPISIATKEGIDDVESTITMPPLVGVPVMTKPESGEPLADRLLAFDLTSPTRPDFYYASIYDRTGTPVWEAFLPSSATSIRFPTFPDFSDLPERRRPTPYPTGLYQVRIYGARHPSASLSDFDYQQISPFEWSAYALNRDTIQFP